MTIDCVSDFACGRRGALGSVRRPSRYRNALFHLLTAEESDYRYWGEGIWADYGAELARRAIDIVTHDL